MENVDKVDEPMDRISELPEPIIHHILSYLDCPRDVARITPLSKKWRSIWASFIFFHFDQKLFKTSGDDHTTKFITYVDNSIATKLDPMHSIHKFKITLSHVTPKLKLHMKKWISCAIKKDVKELEIHVEYMRKTPDVIFSAKTLTSLKLCRCKFSGGNVINLCNLKELSLKKCYIKTDVIQSLIQGCPLVEDLRLIHCTGIGRLQISTLVKLTRVELHKCYGLWYVDIELPSLISFLYWGKKIWQCEINLGGSENLKYLTLKYWNLTDELFQDMVSKFYYLKELSVIRCKKLENVTMYAPHLSALEYSGYKMPFSAIDVAGLREVKLNLKYEGFGKNSRLVHDVLNFLRKFEKDGDWKCVVSSDENVTIYEEARKMSGLSTDDVKVELIKSPLKLKCYVDNLLQMSRPKTLSLLSSSSSEFLKLVKEKIMGREENPKCCTYYLNKCWLHHIKDVKMVVFDSGKTQHLQRTSFSFNWHN